MKSTLYVMDTSVLVGWAFSYLAQDMGGRKGQSDYHAYVSARCRSFCEDKRNRMVIPETVWAELHGFFFHKDIDTQDYAQWYKLRKAAMNPIYTAVFSPESHIALEDIQIDVDLPINLCYGEISDDLLDLLQKRREAQVRSGHYSQDRPPLVKLLDGLDAVIVACAWKMAEDNPEHNLVLVSRDRGLIMMVDYLRGKSVARKPFPPNLTARDVPRHG
jgi:hypothetical protein